MTIANRGGFGGNVVTLCRPDAVARVQDSVRQALTRDGLAAPTFRIVSPAGGSVPLEPRSLTFPNEDRTAKAWQADPAKMALLENTLSPDQVEIDVDVIGEDRAAQAPDQTLSADAAAGLAVEGRELKTLLAQGCVGSHDLELAESVWVMLMHQHLTLP